MLEECGTNETWIHLASYDDWSSVGVTKVCTNFALIYPLHLVKIVTNSDFNEFMFKYSTVDTALFGQEIRGDSCPNCVIVRIKSTIYSSQGVNRVCPEKLSELGSLLELSVVD